MEIVARRPQDLTAAETAAWAALHQKEPHLRHPSLAPGLAVVAAETLGNAEVGVIAEDGEPVGFFPYDRDRGDVGAPLVAPMTDRQAFIARPGLAIDAPTLLRGCGLSAWRFDHLAVPPPPAPDPFAPHVREWDDAFEVDLTGGFDAYVARGSVASFVRQTDRKARKLAREVGPVRFEFRVEDDAVFDRLIRDKQVQLGRQGLRDQFADESLVKMLRRVHRTFEPAGTSAGTSADGAEAGPAFAGVLSVLWAGDEPAATHLGLWAGEEFHSWIPAHSEVLHRYSPGAVLHLEMLREAARRGVTTVDLGRGGNPLKQRLASRRRPLGIGSADLRAWGRATSSARRWLGAVPMARRTRRALRRWRARS
ncbi:GNAT family N-acetyltransferase [Alienimonas sp. DA493]|uniref:GNAT family N-acetyltransferase n=1 Tax=Alienimonas sp. DA493 TaxID=3373605 RepID=UPI003754AFB9